MIHDHGRVLDAMLRAARLAALACRKVQAEDTLASMDAKQGDEPVTVADYASQALILRELARELPGYAILSEEDAAHLRGQHNQKVGLRVAQIVSDVLGETVSFEQLCAWIDHQGDAASEWRFAIDPIDGTKGFLRREQYAIAIGLLLRNEPVAGVLACPSLPEAGLGASGPLGVTFGAWRGEGAFQERLDGGARRPIRVSALTDPGRIRVLGSVESSHGDPALIQAVVDDLGLRGGFVRVDSQVKYAVLARGEAEVYLRPQSKPSWRDQAWDHVAGVAVAGEAGATCTDQDGKALDFSHGRRLEANRGILTTNGPLHGAIVEAIRRAEVR